MTVIYRGSNFRRSRPVAEAAGSASPSVKWHPARITLVRRWNRSKDGGGPQWVDGWTRIYRPPLATRKDVSDADAAADE